MLYFGHIIKLLQWLKHQGFLFYKTWATFPNLWTLLLLIPRSSDLTGSVLRVWAGGRIGGGHKCVDVAGRVDERQKDLLVALLSRLNEDAERSEGSKDCKEVPQQNDSQDGPGCPATIQTQLEKHSKEIWV